MAMCGEMKRNARIQEIQLPEIMADFSGDQQRDCCPPPTFA